MPHAKRLLIASQPLDGGVAGHVVEIAEALAPRYDLEVACPRGSTVWETLSGRKGLRLYEIGSARRPGPGDLRTLARLVRLARREDLVHAHSAKVGFLGRLAAALTGRRRTCVFSPHGWSFWAASGAERRLYLALERLAARWCAVIVTQSDSERQAGLEARIGRPEQYRVVLNGVDVERFGGDPAPVPGRVVWVGRLASAKRPDVALEVGAELRRRGVEVDLVLVGDGPDREEAERLLAELPAGSATLAGRRSDIPELLREASCLLLTSEYESCPLGVIEAMAAGVPVVATAVGGLPELVTDGEHGLLAPAGDVGALADAVQRLVRDPDAAHAMGAAGRERARQKLSRERMVAELEAVYAELQPA
ncbi:MAG: glycosyltransferase family 4 protein [Gaiellaceae bacterium]